MELTGSRRLLIIICTLFSSGYCVPNATVTSTSVQTPIGNFIGRRYTFSYRIPQEETDQVDRYTTIRYADKPVGKFRFERPRPLPESNQGTVNASTITPMCWNFAEKHHMYFMEQLTSPMLEDCLYLNIYSPYKRGQNSQGKLYPVLFYVHGGSYEMNSGVNYTGLTLARYGIVVVTINYRLGPLGFMTAGDGEFEGNYGLWDQIEALKWVQKYIGYFGGDKSQVTLVGHSAGSSSVNLLNISPQAKDLFRYVIAQSGSSESYFAIYPSDTDFAYYFKEFMKVYGCEGETLQHQKHCMQQLSFEELTASDHFDSLPAYHGRDTSWRPRMDRELIPDWPRKLNKDGNFNAERYMTGVTSNEISLNAAMFMAQNKDLSDTPFPEFQPTQAEAAIRYTCESYYKFPSIICEAIDALYNVKQSTISTTNRSYFLTANYAQIFFDVFNDYIMLAPTMSVAQDTSLKIPTFVYLYDHFSSKSFNKPWVGVHHSTELQYLFGSYHTSIYSEHTGDKYIPQYEREHSLFVQRLWINFVKFGDPTPTKADAQYFGEAWSAYTSKTDNIARITKGNLEMMNYFRKDKIIFWNKIVPRLRGIDPPKSDYCEAEKLRITIALIVVASVFFLFIIIVVLLVCFSFSGGMLRRRWRRRKQHRAGGDGTQEIYKPNYSNQNGKDEAAEPLTTLRAPQRT